jgi:phosphate uptake regulator
MYARASRLDFRKVQRTSDGTYFVTLPKSWANLHKIERGSLVSFDAAKDGKLTLGLYHDASPPASVVLSPTPMLEREIEEKYLLGYDHITIASNEVLNSKIRDSAKTILRKLVGLEIVEEDAHRLAIQCLIEPSLLAPEKIIRRLHSITKAMQQDAVTAFRWCDPKLAATVVERDEEVDRLYFFLVRIVRTALTDLSAAERIHASLVDCLDYRLLASFIEHFGDYSASIAQNTPANDRHLSKTLSRSLDRSGRNVNSMYSLSIEAVLSRSLNMASSASDFSKEALRALEVAERALKGASSELFGKATSVISSLKSMCELSIDIADLAITR